MTMSDPHSEEDNDMEEEEEEPTYDSDSGSDDGKSFTKKPRGQTAVDAEFLETMDQTASITDLHRSNLLRLQTQELVSACQLELSLQEQHVQWADVAHEYINAVTALIETIPATTIRHSKQSPFLSQSDKKKDLTVELGKTKLTVEPTACYQAGIGLTVPSGNANVLPTLDLVVKLPNDMFDDKDYLRHRYFDVRCIILHCIALLTLNSLMKLAWYTA
jgi:hypothetical protein